MTQPKAPRAPIRNIGIGDLRNYDLPVPAKVSILHRVSGLLLFLFLPLLLWLFEQSLSSETSYERFLGFTHHVAGRLLLLVLGWGLLHHACAGVRFLLLDLHLGTERAAARQSAWWVLVVSLTLTLGLARWIFWPNG